MSSDKMSLSLSFSVPSHGFIIGPLLITVHWVGGDSACSLKERQPRYLVSDGWHFMSVSCCLAAEINLTSLNEYKLKF